MPSSPQASTTARMLRSPRRCPSIRGSPRPRAQRPFPSMMIAMCCGRSMARYARCARRLLDLHQLRVLRRLGDVQLVDILVGELLDLLFGALLLIFGHVAGLL